MTHEHVLDRHYISWTIQSRRAVIFFSEPCNNHEGELHVIIIEEGKSTNDLAKQQQTTSQTKEYQKGAF